MAWVHLYDRQSIRQSAFRQRDECPATLPYRSRRNHFLLEELSPIYFLRTSEYVAHAVSIWCRPGLREDPRSARRFWPARPFCDNPRPARAPIWKPAAKYRPRDLPCYRPDESPREYRDRAPKMLWPVHTRTTIVPGWPRRSLNRNTQPSW